MGDYTGSNHVGDTQFESTQPASQLEAASPRTARDIDDAEHTLCYSRRMADGMRSGFYFVAFVDLLGQQAKLARFKGVAPTTDEERAAFRRLVDDTAGVVRNERESIAQWLAT